MRRNEQRRRRVGAVVVASLLSACKLGATEDPGSHRDDARSPPTQSDPATSSTSADALPSRRDRDPEAEKRKMMESRGRSAQAVKMLRAGREADAIASSRAALKIHEQNVEAMLVLAEVFYRQGKFELVNAVTSSALAVDEKTRLPAETSRAYNLKGFAFVGMNEDSKATQAFRKAAEADEKNAAAWNNLGTRYLESGDVATALSCFTYAIKLQPRFAKAHLNLGAALRAKGEWVAAERSFNTALQLKPNYAEAYFDLGLLYLDAPEYPGLDVEQRLARAIGHFERYKALGGGAHRLPARRARDLQEEVVSVSRADDYIRVAKKGLEREQRRAEREKTRQSSGSGEPSSSAATADGSNPAAPKSAPSPTAPPPAAATPVSKPLKPKGQGTP